MLCQRLHAFNVMDSQSFMFGREGSAPPTRAVQPSPTMAFTRVMTNYGHVHDVASITSPSSPFFFFLSFGGECEIMIGAFETG